MNITSSLRASLRCDCILLLTIVVLILAGSSTLCWSQSCPAPFMEFKTISTNRVKTGVWGNTVGGVASTNRYRSVQTIYSSAAAVSYSGGSSCEILTASYDYYPATYFPTQLVFSGGCPLVYNGSNYNYEIQTFTKGEEGMGTTSCTIARTNEGTWFPSSTECLDYGCPEFALTFTNDCSLPTTETLQYVCFSYGDGAGKTKSTAWWQQLGDIYTTTELIGLMEDDMENLDYPPEWSRGGGVATLNLACYESIGNASKSKYRIGFQSETNTTYSVIWEEVTTYPDGTSSTATRQAYVEGNGEVVYTPEYIMALPGSPATINAQIGAGGVTVVPNSGSPPGGGGPGGGGRGGEGAGGIGGCTSCSGGATGGGGAGSPSQNPNFRLELGSASGSSN